MTTDAVGGVWTYAIEMARGLSAEGAAVTLVVLGPAPKAEQRAAAGAIPGLDLVVTGLPLDWTAEHPRQLLDAGEAVAALAREHRATLVHLNSPALAAGAAFDRPILGLCHSCVATWWRALRGDAALPADLAWRADLVACGYDACDALIAPSAAFAQATAEAYGLSPPTIVHNGVAPRRPIAPLGAAQPASFIFTAGRLWDEGKNLALLDRAAARLAVPVVAAGPTRGPNGAGIDLHHIQHAGTLGSDEIANHLAGRPVFCSPARYEPFGLAVLEAAAAGCALVLSDIPTFRELWSGAAVFVPPDDERALAATLDPLAGNAAERRRLGDAAQRKAGAYSAAAMVAGTIAVQARLLGRVTRSREAADVFPSLRTAFRDGSRAG